MSLFATESFPNPQDMAMGFTGTIVLSSSCRQVFIDRNAIALLSLIESDFIPQKDVCVIPECLLDLAREIMTASCGIHTNSCAMGAQVRRIFGPPE